LVVDKGLMFSWHACVYADVVNPAALPPATSELADVAVKAEATEELRAAGHVAAHAEPGVLKVKGEQSDGEHAATPAGEVWCDMRFR
jgi:hypothetical protein